MRRRVEAIVPRLQAPCGSDRLWREFQHERLRGSSQRAPAALAVGGAFQFLAGVVRALSAGEDMLPAFRARPLWFVSIVLWRLKSRLPNCSQRGASEKQHYDPFAIALSVLSVFLGYALTLLSVWGHSVELMAHRTFLLRYFCQMFCCLQLFYLPSSWHIYVVTVPGICCWMWFHWRLGFLAPVPVFWGLALPIMELILSRSVEQRDWQLFQIIRKEEKARMRGESVEAALRGMLSSVFDASCECDGHGTVLSASPHLQQLMGGPVAERLADLALTSAESARIVALVRQSLNDSSVDRGRCASKIATSLRRQALIRGKDDFELRVTLSCVALPSEEGDLSSRRLIFGFQESQPLEVDAASPSLEALRELDNESTPLLGADKLGSIGHLVHDASIQHGACEETASLGSFWTNAVIPSKEDETRSLTSLALSQTQATSAPGSAGIKTRIVMDASTQTAGISGRDFIEPAVDASVQTTISTSRPPLPQPHAPNTVAPTTRAQRRRATLQGGHRSMKRFKETPQGTVKVLVRHMLDRFNPRGRSCCPYHLALAAVSRSVDKLNETACEKAAFRPCKGWQCQHCFALNDVASDDEACDACEVCQRGRPSQVRAGGDDGSESSGSASSLIRRAVRLVDTGSNDGRKSSSSESVWAQLAAF